MEMRRPGAAATDNGPATGSGPAARVWKAVDVSALLRLRERMRQQLEECSVTVDTDQIFCTDHVIDEHYPNGVTAYLESVTEDLKLTLESKTLALQRMQLGLQLKNKVKKPDIKSRLIIRRMKHITMLSGTVIEYQQQAREKEHKLIDIKRKRLSLKKSIRQKILQIHTMIKKIKEKQGQMKVMRMLQAIRRSIQKETQRITILQNVFQNILIGSRVNWAEDPSLKAVVLQQLEKNVCSM